MYQIACYCTNCHRDYVEPRPTCDECGAATAPAQQSQSWACESCHYIPCKCQRYDYPLARILESR